MSWLRRLLQPSSKPADAGTDLSPTMQAIPTIKFDPSVLTKGVKADLRRNVESLPGMEKRHFKPIYELALRSLVGRRDFYSFCNEMMEMHIEGLTRSKAAEIGTSLANKAGAVIEREKRVSLGITHAKWIYVMSCLRDPANPSVAEVQRDVAHQAADGKRFEVSKGLFLDGKWTWPGVEDNCHCISRALIPGLEDWQSNVRKDDHHGTHFSCTSCRSDLAEL